MDRHALLRSVSLFSSLDERELDRLIQATTTRRLRAKEVLNKQLRGWEEAGFVTLGRGRSLLGEPQRHAELAEGIQL